MENNIFIPLMGNSGSRDEALRAVDARAETILQLPAVREYVEALYKLGPETGVNPSLAFAQAVHETGFFTSYWWSSHLNPAGLGITGDEEQNADSRNFETGTNAARGQLAHLMLYATGDITSPLTKEDDPRYLAYVEAYDKQPKARTLADLAGTWAADTEYAQKVARVYYDIFSDEVITPTDVENQPTNKVDVIKYPSGEEWDGERNTSYRSRTYWGQKRTVVVSSTDGLNVRTGPNTGSNVVDTLEYRTDLDVLGYIVGQRVDGTAKWWVTPEFRFVWSGGTFDDPR